MADNDDVPGSPDRDAVPAETTPAGAPEESAPTASQPVVPAEPAAAAPILKTRWRDRAWSFRAMLAVAAASLVIGGVAGGVLGAAAGGGDDDHHRVGPWGPGGPMMGGPGGHGNGPWGYDDGGPKWRWNDGSQQPPLTPYGGTTPGPVSPSP